MAYYTSKYSGEEIDALLDKIAASAAALAASNTNLSDQVAQLSARVAALEGKGG